jgi:large subunit ribosomal protein L3
MPGHMGAVRKTVQNLKVFRTDIENNLLLVRGACPGNKNSYLIIRAAVKQKRPKAVAPVPTKAKAGQARK